MAQKVTVKKKGLSEAEIQSIFKAMAPHKMMVNAIQMEEDFSITDTEGEIIEGKKGDFLVKYSNEELAIFEKDNFQEHFSYSRS